METLFNTTDALRKICKAFNAMRKEGITAAMNYMCCDRCGRATAPLFTSLVFYSRQDAMDFPEKGVLFIKFISSGGDPASTRALGDQVRILLEINGLQVEWDGNPDQTIMVLA